MKSSPPLVDATEQALRSKPVSEVLLMPDESNITTTPESMSCDALDEADIGAMLNEAACGLDEPPAKMSETQSATGQDAKDGSSAGETVASPPAPVDDVVADEPAPNRKSEPVGEVPWDEQPSSGKDAGTPALSADTVVPEVPDKTREPEDRWSLATPNAGEVVGTSEMPSSGPERRWNVVVRLLGSVLEVLDQPFARLAPQTKDLIGYAAIATFVMAIAVWALVILLT